MLFETPLAKARKALTKAPTKAYTVIAEFWHAGVLRAEGEVIHLTEAAAKYWSHAVAPVEAKVEAKVEAVIAPVEKAAKPVEKPAEKPAAAPADAPAGGK